MRYISTRGQVPALDFRDVTLAGLAGDGGLYVPEAWPKLDAGEIAALAGKSYADTAFTICRRFTGDVLADADLKRLIDEAYAGFDHAAVTPLVQLDGRHFLLELFHGPTLAFKDVALQFLGLLFEHFLAGADRHMTIVGATSGDTGSAAIHALAGRENVDVFMLHPDGRVSDVQRRQMTTVMAPNIHNIAVEGVFDDCQDIVKAVSNDLEFKRKYRIGTVNSINWARLVAQVVYYFYAATALGAPHRAVSFTVPTGVASVLVEATATDSQGASTTASRTVAVVPDPLTTVTGRLVDTAGRVDRFRRKYAGSEAAQPACRRASSTR